MSDVGEGPGRAAYKIQAQRNYIRRMNKKGLNKRQKMQVKRLVAGAQELKYLGTVINGTNMTNSFTITSLSDVPQGDTDQARDGDRMKLKKHMDIYCAINTIVANTNAVNRVRIVIFQWKPNTTPVAADIFLTGTSGSIDVSSRYSHDSRQLYKILLDRTWTLVGTGSTGTSNILTSRNSTTMNRRNLILRKIATQCQFVAATTAGTNKIWLAHISDQASNYPVMYFGSKIFFSDS